jgi:hypothetical protein
MFSNYFSNPNAAFIKKYLYEILKERYMENEKFIDRICDQLTMRDDAQSFVKLTSDAFQKGYILAVEQHREALAKVGMDVKITNPVSNLNKIFNQKNQGGLEKGQ